MDRLFQPVFELCQGQQAIHLPLQSNFSKRRITVYFSTMSRERKLH